MIDLLAQMPVPEPPESLAGADVIAFVLLDLAIILIAARIVGGVFVRIGQPRVVGEIIAGILIGPTVLGGKLATPAITDLDRPAVDGSGLVNDVFPLQAFSFLNLLGTLTLVFFMFLVGLEVQQRFLKGKGPQIIAVALAVTAVPVVLGFVFTGLFSGAEYKPEGVSDGTQGLILGAAIAVTAFPVMARILQEKRQIATPMGAVGVGAAAVVTPLMFLVLAGASASAKGQGAPDAIGMRLVLALAFALLCFVVVRPLLQRFLLRGFDPDRPLSNHVLAVLLAGALLGGLAGDRIGIHSLNGAFIFGACVPQIEGLGKAVLDRMSDFVAIFLIPVFLAVAGLQTDFRVLTAGLIPGILVFLAFMVAGKWLVGWAAARAVGLENRDAQTIGVLMNCRGLMLLVVAVVAGQFDGITPEMRVVFALGAIVTTMMTGPLVDLFLPKEDVEAERERSISGSLAALPAMTGGPRVVIVPAEPAHASAAASAAAERFLGRDGPAPQFLVTNLPGLSATGDYVGALVESGEGRSVTQTLGWLGPAAARLAAGGAQAEAVSFQTPDPDGDLAKLATDWAATDAVVTSEEHAAVLEAAGIAVHRAPELASRLPATGEPGVAGVSA